MSDKVPLTLFDFEKERKLYTSDDEVSDLNNKGALKINNEYNYQETKQDIKTFINPSTYPQDKSSSFIKGKRRHILLNQSNSQYINHYINNQYFLDNKYNKLDLQNQKQDDFNLLLNESYPSLPCLPNEKSELSSRLIEFPCGQPQDSWSREESSDLDIPCGQPTSSYWQLKQAQDSTKDHLDKLLKSSSDSSDSWGWLLNDTDTVENENNTVDPSKNNPIDNEILNQTFLNNLDNLIKTQQKNESSFTHNDQILDKYDPSKPKKTNLTHSLRENMNIDEFVKEIEHSASHSLRNIQLNENKESKDFNVLLSESSIDNYIMFNEKNKGLSNTEIQKDEVKKKLPSSPKTSESFLEAIKVIKEIQINNIKKDKRKCDILEFSDSQIVSDVNNNINDNTDLILNTQKQNKNLKLTIKNEKNQNTKSIIDCKAKTDIFINNQEVLEVSPKYSDLSNQVLVQNQYSTSLKQDHPHCIQIQSPFVNNSDHTSQNKLKTKEKSSNAHFSSPISVDDLFNFIDSESLKNNNRSTNKIHKAQNHDEHKNLNLYSKTFNEKITSYENKNPIKRFTELTNVLVPFNNNDQMVFKDGKYSHLTSKVSDLSKGDNDKSTRLSSKTNFLFENTNNKCLFSQFSNDEAPEPLKFNLYSNTETSLNLDKDDKQFDSKHNFDSTNQLNITAIENQKTHNFQEYSDSRLYQNHDKNDLLVSGDLNFEDELNGNCKLYPSSENSELNSKNEELDTEIDEKNFKDFSVNLFYDSKINQESQISETKSLIVDGKIIPAPEGYWLRESLKKVKRCLRDSRCILHIDVDCFYAQVEHKRLGISTDVPLAVQQWNGLLAVNYSARKYGITRMETPQQAKAKCSELMLVHVPTYAQGATEWAYNEDASFSTHKASLAPYRHASDEIFEIFCSFTPKVQKGGCDEAFIDVTDLVNERILKDCELTKNFSTEPLSPLDWKGMGHVIKIDREDSGLEGEEKPLYLSDCYTSYWKDRQLLAGAKIAAKIRATVYSKLGFTCGAGIAHNKHMAKLCSSQNKPNQQTILREEATLSFLKDLPVTKIRFMAGKVGHLVEHVFGKTCGSLWKYSLLDFQKVLGKKNASFVYDICRGINHKPVRPVEPMKTIMSGKSLIPACTDYVNLFKWIEILSTEIVHRLENSVEDERWPKSLTLSIFSPEGQNDYLQTSCSMPPLREVMSNPNIIVSKAIEMCKSLSNPFPCKFVCLSAIGLEESSCKRNHVITDFFKPVDSVMSVTNNLHKNIIYSSHLNQSSIHTDHTNKNTNNIPDKLSKHRQIHYAQADTSKSYINIATQVNNDPSLRFEKKSGSKDSIKKFRPAKSSSIKEKDIYRTLNNSVMFVGSSEKHDKPPSNLDRAQYKRSNCSLILNDSQKETHNDHHLAYNLQKSTYKCIECNVMVELENKVAHEDSHFAKELQKKFNWECDAFPTPSKLRLKNNSDSILKANSSRSRAFGDRSNSEGHAESNKNIYPNLHILSSGIKKRGRPRKYAIPHMKYLKFEGTSNQKYTNPNQERFFKVQNQTIESKNQDNTIVILDDSFNNGDTNLNLSK